LSRDGLLVGADGGRVVALIDRVVGLLVQRGQRRLLRGGGCGIRVARAGAHDRDLSRDTALGGGLENLLEHLAHLGFGDGALEQLQRAPADDGRDRRNGLRLERLRQLGVLVDIYLDEHEPATEFGDEFVEDGRQLLARLAPLGPQVDDDGNLSRQVEELGEVLIGSVEDEPGQLDDGTSGTGLACDGATATRCVPCGARGRSRARASGPCTVRRARGLCGRLGICPIDEPRQVDGSAQRGRVHIEIGHVLQILQ
jgi:hypothetical protein